MNPITREIDGRLVEFRKATESHLDGQDCLYFGSESGKVYLFEEDSPDTIVTTTAGKWEVFARAVSHGEFQARV
jgi:hypothetical protein